MHAKNLFEQPPHFGVYILYTALDFHGYMIGKGSDDGNDNTDGSSRKKLLRSSVGGRKIKGSNDQTSPYIQTLSMGQRSKDGWRQIELDTDRRKRSPMSFVLTDMKCRIDSKSDLKSKATFNGR